MADPAAKSFADELESPLARTVRRKVAWRLLPLLFALYLVNILDRINIGFASLQMKAQFDLSDAAIGLASGIFYLSYIVFEVPSNLILHRVGARRWLSRIIVSWGVVSGAMMLVQGIGSLCTLRLLLGVAEAGFFPGVVLYVGYWFPARDRARAVALFMTASPLAGVVGNAVSGWIMQYMHGLGSLAGWQWLFLLEGLPSVVLGVVVWFYLTDRPEQARWLSPTERDWLAKYMAGEEFVRQQRHGLSRLQAMSDRRVWRLICIYFTVAVGSNCFGFFLPQIISAAFYGRASFATAAGTVGLLAAPTGTGPLLAMAAATAQTPPSAVVIGLLGVLPNLVGVIGMILISMHSDRTRERRLHVALSALLSAVGWGLAAVAPSPWLALLGLGLAQMGMMSMLPTFWALAGSLLSGAGAAAGIALINSVANLGGYLGPQGLGLLKVATGGFTVGLLAVAGTMLVGSMITVHIRYGAKKSFQNGDATLES
jgi:ACS family tartrate transporter-like MFS transporter